MVEQRTLTPKVSALFQELSSREHVYPVITHQGLSEGLSNLLRGRLPLGLSLKGDEE